MWEPVGPLPASVYWRRRCLAMAAVLGVLAAIGWAVALRPAPVGSTASAEGPRPGETAGPSAPVAASNPVPCGNEMISVESGVDRPEHRIGEQAQLRLVVTNVSGQPCVRDLDAARQEIVVWSGDGATRLWSSNDCVSTPSIDLRTLVPGRPVAFGVTWAGRTSTLGCAQPRTVVPAGDYMVLTRVDDVVSAPTPFRRSD